MPGVDQQEAANGVGSARLFYIRLNLTIPSGGTQPYQRIDELVWTVAHLLNHPMKKILVLGFTLPFVVDAKVHRMVIPCDMV